MRRRSLLIMILSALMATAMLVTVSFGSTTVVSKSDNSIAVNNGGSDNSGAAANGASDGSSSGSTSGQGVNEQGSGGGAATVVDGGGCGCKKATDTSTQLSVSTIYLGQSVTDTATVTSSAGVPAGTVNFWYNDGSGTHNYAIGVALVNGVASAVFTPSAIGSYQLGATYSGSSYYYGSSSLYGSEPLSVIMASTTTVTKLAVGPMQVTQVVVYTTVTDYATVSSTYGIPTGTVNFWVYDGNNISSWYYGNNVPLVSGVASASFTPIEIGVYQFGADYSGTSLYMISSTDFGDEPLTVVSPGSSIATDLSANTIALGGTVTDSVIVYGLGGSVPAPNGTAQFQILVSGVWTTYSTKTLSSDGSGNGIATSDPCPLMYLPASGTYYFRAVYTTSDSIYSNRQTGDSDEPLIVTGCNCECHGKMIHIGQSVTDNATVTGLGDGFPMPTGTVDFWVKFVGNNSEWCYCNAAPLINGKATSCLFTPAMTGQYYFKAVYSGDSNYQSSSDKYENEPLCVLPACTTTTTQLTDMAGNNIQSIIVYNQVVDTATVTSIYGIPTGTVDFWVYYSGNSTKWYYSNDVALVNGKASAVFLPVAVGNYKFGAEYHSNSYWSDSSSAVDSEPLIVMHPGILIVTNLGVTSIVLGQTVTDNVTVAGMGGIVPAPSGTVQFQILVSGVWTTYSTKTLSDDGSGNGIAVSGPCPTIYLSATGTYYFRAVYTSSDLIYASGQSGDSAEPLIITWHPTTTTTCLGTCCITLGQSVTDNATVVTGLGAPFPGPTGTVDFWVYDHVNNTVWYYCNGVPLVNGKATSTKFTPLTAGDYNFGADYSGDNNYMPSSSCPCDEHLCVCPYLPVVVTSLGTCCITLGQSVTDNATVIGLGAPFPGPTGTVSFWVYYSGNSTKWYYSNNVPLVGGAAISSVFTPHAAGFYYFGADYSGDSNYKPAYSPVYSGNGYYEPLCVEKAPTTTVTDLGGLGTEID